MRQFVDLQDKHDCYIFIADLHALTTLQDADELRQNIADVAIDYLAIGLDPKKVVLFKQSDIPEITELAWIFNCITTMPHLMRAHAYKDAEAKNKEINVGIFDYPILMAADILIQDADIVPVGQDQKQHLEITRDIAEKFNRIFGNTFRLPEALILESVKTVPGIDGQKMSKSYNNTIPLFATDDEIEKLVMSIVTDSSAETPINVRAIHELVRDKESLDRLYQENKGKYKALKEALIEDLKAFIKPLRDKRSSLASDSQNIRDIVNSGTEAARARAQKKLVEVKKVIGAN